MPGGYPLTDVAETVVGGTSKIILQSFGSWTCQVARTINQKETQLTHIEARGSLCN